MRILKIWSWRISFLKRMTQILSRSRFKRKREKCYRFQGFNKFHLSILCLIRKTMIWAMPMKFPNGVKMTTKIAWKNQLRQIRSLTKTSKRSSSAAHWTARRATSTLQTTQCSFHIIKTISLTMMRVATAIDFSTLQATSSCSWNSSMLFMKGSWKQKTW